MKTIYLAGDMLNKGAQMQRAMERDEILKLGYKIYNPMDNKEINDKQNCVQEGLAERIVRHDTDALMNADIVIFEPLAHAVGTQIEMGQIKGAKDWAKIILNKIDSFDGYDLADLVTELEVMCKEMVRKKIYTHNSDIRRHNIPEVGDRRSFAPHQYMYGVNLDITDGVGFMEWEEIIDILGRNK